MCIFLFLVNNFMFLNWPDNSQGNFLLFFCFSFYNGPIFICNIFNLISAEKELFSK